MKTKLLLLFLIGCLGFVQAQTGKFEKPRYLKFGTFVCPVDMANSYNGKGLFDNKVTTELKSKIVSEIVGEEKLTITKKANDTILLKTIFIEKGYAFDVVQQIGSYSIIKFWNLKDATATSLFGTLKENNQNVKIMSAQKSKSANEKDSFAALDLSKDISNYKIEGLVASNGKENIDLSKTYYVVPTKTVENNSTEFESKTNQWSIGILALPVKTRPFATKSGQFDFSSGFSVGTTLAWTVHHNWQTNFTHNILLYAGVSSYKAEKSKLYSNPVVSDETETIATFSPALGYMWEKHNVQLTLLAGVDLPAGKIQKEWVYRNMPWLGIGVGIGLFKIDNEKDNNTKSKEQ